MSDPPRPANSPPLPVGIAVVEHAGRYLVGERPAGTPLAGSAEFPGGKCLPGESPRQCAVRECEEETGLSIHAERLLLTQTFHYPHAAVELHFWLCRPQHSAEPLAEHRGFRWIPAAELHHHAFPPANAEIVRLLTEHAAGEL